MKTLIGRTSGQTITIMGGVHGDEPSGIRIVQYLMEKYERIEQGKLHFILANTLAITRKQRCVFTNMNRAFIDNLQAQTWEEKRAQELLPLLRSTDVLIDIHNTIRTNTQPFVICEKPDEELCACFWIDKVVSGLVDIHVGSSDAYVHSHGWLAISLEVGSAGAPYLETQIAKTIDALLNQQPLTRVKLRHYRAKELIRAEALPWCFEQKWGDFDSLPQWAILGYENGEPRYIPYDCVLLFPKLPQQIGDEVVVLLENKS